jgi:hypothetical protein
MLTTDGSLTRRFTVPASDRSEPLQFLSHEANPGLVESVPGHDLRRHARGWASTRRAAAAAMSIGVPN